MTTCHNAFSPGGGITCTSRQTTELQPLAVNARQLGEMLALSLRSIRTLDAAGKLPRPVRLNGRAVRGVLSEMESWLAAGAPDRSTWEAVGKNGRPPG